MIGYLRGKILEVSLDKWIVDVNGVGYRVVVAEKMAKSKQVGDEVTVRIFTYVKEDVLALYGFASTSELDLFEKLLSVSGIGPKMAMNVFNAGSASEIAGAIRSANVDFFTAVSGIGKKGAQRLIVELKSKLGGEGEIDLGEYPEKQDALKGLMALGYSKQEALEGLKKVDGKLSAEEQIKLALKNV